MPTRRHFLQTTTALAAAVTAAPWLWQSAQATEPLLTRKIPRSGEALPVIGLGTSGNLDVDLNDAALAPLQEVLKALLDGGGTLIDTAPSYGNSERVAGELVRRAQARDKVFLATKISSTGRERGAAQLAASFRALQTERLDLVQVHNLQDTANQLALLREQQQAGKVRYVGVTHYREAALDDLLATLKKEKVDFVQFNYSVGEREAEKRLLPYCRDQGIAVLINRPFQRGNLLSGTRGKPLPPLAAELGATSWAQLLLKFILADPAVTAVIPATSNPCYMVDNLQAGRGRLPDARQREAIAGLFA